MENLLNSKVITTAILAILVFAFKYALVKMLRARAKRKDEDRRDLINNIKNLINFLLILVLLSLWVEELQQFALSIAAFAVAIVLATREFIQCVIGFFYLMSSRPFRVGDWIQVDDFAGEVTETDWIKSTLMEIDQRTYEYSGKTLYIPNNKMINSTIKNLNFLKRYVTHHFKIIRDGSVNPYVFLDVLHDKAKTYCADFHDVAVRYNHMIERRLDVKISGPHAQIAVTTTELGHTVIEFTVFCPTNRAIEIEQKLTADFMQLWFAEKQKSASELGAD